MDKVTELDQTRHELALGTGLMGEAYTIEEAKLIAEQRSLDWENVKDWAGLNNKESEL